MTECTITSVDFDDKLAKLTQLRFQNGQLIHGNEAELSGGIYTDSSRNIIPALASETLLYTGQVMKEYNYNTFIGIRNKKTNKMKLIAVDQALLKPQPPKMREILDSTMMEVNKRALTELNKEFGSKKIKRQTEQSERLKVNVENYKDQLEKTIANVTVDELDLGTKVQTSDYLPPINKEAETKEDVYTLARLVPLNVVKSLTTHAENLLNLEESEICTTDYVKEKILNIRDSGEDSAKDSIALWLIIDGLLNINTASARNIAHKNYQPSAYSKILSEFILETFTIKTDKTRTRPLSMKDKTACYIIVLSLLMNKYMVNLEQMSSMLKNGKKKLQDLCRMLLLHVTECTAVVKLPLPAPINLIRSPKKSKK